MAPKKVAILGGGMGGLSAAMALSRPELKGRYEITVYQQGWRLGGKGASSRNAQAGQRIEEHGLHLWMGCYENAFRLIREAYAEEGADWKDAFISNDLVVLQEHHRGRWTPWVQRFPVLDNQPGESGQIAGPLEMIGALLRWMLGIAKKRPNDVRHAPPAWALLGRDPPATETVSTVERILGAALSAWREAVGRRTQAVVRAASWTVSKAMYALREALAWAYGRELDDPQSRRIFITLDYLSSNLIGILAEGFIAPKAGSLAELSYADWLARVEAIDDLDYRDWLLQQGARLATVRSCVVRGLGDAVFNSGHPGSAAWAVNGLIRLNLTYRGSLFYRMAAGMGETVFAPLYQALKRRGVRFQFFHRVDELVLDPEGRKLAKIVFARQAEAPDYQPLTEIEVPAGKLRVWPQGPDLKQLVNGERYAGVDFEDPRPIFGEQRLELQEFDAVVLGISHAALPRITPQLSARSQSWRQMLQMLKTTRTQAAQLWLNSPLEALGWREGPGIVTAYAESLDTWADMSHLVATENVGAQAVTYLCGSLDDRGPNSLQQQRVRETGQAWLEQHLPHLLPGMAGPGGLRYENFHDPYNRVGAARLDAQLFRANVHPSERYVLSTPGSGRYRLRSNQSGFERLYLAGDWVKTGLNVGCIEAAAMAGLQAARAIHGGGVPSVGDISD